MRLIDADGVKDSLLTELLMGVDGGTDDSWLKAYEVINRIENIVNEWVDNQPTVKAIPIEFIEERIRKAVAFTHSKAEGNIIADRGVVTITSASFTAQVLANLLKAWEGQNEKDI